ncbi:glycoside hydrolase [Tamilnaduibacter salinus]|uniref:Glycoside hydrolase n=1 Tax=Tamilnaduibacter salinus TaxID=1484056 RepID=A0A2A2I5D1_9GAMM|nr:glycosyltransferase family 1 protein [Tamilnaduibacter salinus]PAV27221.1 glycoside hydrolase [Tamilnaduibacter salinus]
MPATSTHIVIVTETFPPEINGVSHTLGRLCEGLDDRGHRVSVVRPRQRSEPQDTDQGTVVARGETTIVTGLPLPGYPELRFGMTSWRRLRRLWRRQRPTAIYVATEGPLGLAAVRAARALSIPVCSGFHTNFHQYTRHYGVAFLERAITAYMRWFHNRTQRTLVPTRRTRQALEQMGIHNARIWSRGVDCQRFSPAFRDASLRAEWGLADHEIAVLYVGRIAAEKNINLAASCFERLRRLHPSARFILVGDGPMRRSLEEKHPDYIFCGMRRGEDLARHYASGDLFLFPSQTETFGNVVTEAMASSLAVVAFQDGAAGELIHPQTNGMTVPVGDDDGFVNAALRLTDQPAFRRHVRERARQDALELDWPNLIARFERLILETPQEEIGHARRQSVPPV